MAIKKLLLCVATSTILMATAQAAVDRPLWLRYPSISPDGKQIAFAYQGDIYRVPTSGGLAVRLTTNSAYESMPIWSPDSKQIAFTSDRNGRGVNIYVMNAQGGEARQITTHSSSEAPYSFSPDGAYILFKAGYGDTKHSQLDSDFKELYRIPVKGGRAERLMGVQAEYASLSADGKRILYQNYKGYEDEWRKKHTSSITRDICEYDIAKKTFRFIIQHDGEDRNPIYTPDGNGIYFISERNGKTMNVYRSDLNGNNITEVTNFKGEPVRFLSSDRAGRLCYGYAGEIYTQTQGGKPERVAISIDNDTEPDQPFKLNSSMLMSSAVSPNGKQIAFTARGEVFVTSTDYTTTKRITHTAGAERGLTFGADNRTLVYASARDGQWDLYRARLDRKDDPNFPNATSIKEDKLIPEIKGEKTTPKFSPDGKEIAFIYNRKNLVVYNLASKKLRQITDESIMHGPGSVNFEWSPDGKWFAISYTARNHAPYSDIGLVSSNGEGKIFNITNSGYADGNPRWAMDGNALIYTTERYGMRNHASWGSMNDIMMVFLNRAAMEKYRMTEEELELFEEQEKQNKKAEEAAKTADKKGDKGKKAETKSTPKKKEILIEWDGLEDRRVRLTPNSSDLSDAIVSPDGKKLYYFSSIEGRYDLWVLDLRKRTTKILNKLNASSPWFDIDAEGKTIFILGSTAQKLDPKSETLKPIMASAEVRLDRAAEREAMFNEVVLEEGLRFYRADMHGVDWAKLTDYYRRYLPYINNNHDFAEMLSELLGELNASHTGARYRSSAFAEEPTAELGLFFAEEYKRDGLIVEEVIAGGPFDRSTSKLRAGDVITAIDGTEIKAGQDYFPLLNGKVGKTVIISFHSSVSGNIVEERVKPISAGMLNSLLYKRWVRNRAAMVDSLSGGQLGYVHIASMGDRDFRTAYSEVMGRYYDRKGIVIDIRNNGGGRLHEDIEVLFSGQKYLQQEIRGKDYCEMPSRRWNHASIMLVCEADYSNAHGTPWVYKHRKLGKVVGMPVAGTMTSVNWVTLQDPSMVFGIPAVGYRTAEGTYLENTQLEPDVKVDLDPAKALNGRDTQLEVAVSTLMKDLGLKSK